LIEEFYVSIDIESDGPIPGEYSMLSYGACVVGDTTKAFYDELQPVSPFFVKEALDVCKLDRERLFKEGTHPAVSMDNFQKWLRKIDSRRPVFVGFNATFDWQFINYYFHKYLNGNPFGHSGLDIKAYYMGMRDELWYKTGKRVMKKELDIQAPHTHNALQDAIEQSIIFEKLLEL